MANEKKFVKQEKKLFFSWTNLKWVVTEIMKLYSNQKSFFSKKRIESGIAFIIAQWGMIFFLFKKIEVMTMADMFMWAGIEFLIAGYMINQIQKEKKVTEVEEAEEA
jgi:predicted transporter